MTTGRMRPILATLGLAALALSACSGEGASSSAGLDTGVYARLELEVAYPEPFSFLGSVRELLDGSVMAADPLSQVLLRLDLMAGTADTLGQVGGGPEEYQQPDQVFPLPGDSTLLVDIGKTELMVVDPEGGFHSGMKMASVTEDGSFTIITPRYLDALGRTYFVGGGGMGRGPADSTRVSRYDRGTGEIVTLGWTWRPEPTTVRSGDNIRMMGIQMAARDDWAAGPDGQFVVVRADGYVVEWHHPDGRVVTGPPNPVETPRITDEDKYTYLEQRSASGLMTSIMMGGSGAMDMSMRRGGGSGRRAEPDLTEDEWAEEFAPFRPDRARVAPTGELWVERWFPADQPPEMDVFDGDGVKLGSVEFPLRRELIGWGRTADGGTALYLVRTDDVDLKWLERYRVVR